MCTLSQKLKSICLTFVASVMAYRAVHLTSHRDLGTSVPADRKSG